MADVDSSYVPPMTDEYIDAAPEDVMSDLDGQEVRRAEPVPQGSTGTRFDFSAFSPIVAAAEAGDMETARKLKDQLSPVQQHVLERASYTEEYTAEDAARDASSFLQVQDRIKINQADPAKRAEAAAQQAEVQEAYRQEVEYQRSLATINDSTKSSAERNAARMQIEALSAGIGKRINPKLGTSAAAMSEAKNAVGYIGAYEYKNPLADFGSRISTMQRNSQERMGLVRQQMEAAGVPVPEMAVPEAAPSPEDAAAQIGTMVLSQGALKDQAGSAVTIGGSPVIRYPEGGKTVFKKRGPGGGWIDLTAEEMASIGAQ